MASCVSRLERGARRVGPVARSPAMEPGNTKPTVQDRLRKGGCLLLLHIFMFIVGMMIGLIAQELFLHERKKKKRIEFEKTSFERWNEIVNSDIENTLNAIPPSVFDKDDPFMQDRLDDELGPFLPGIEYSEYEQEKDLSMLQTRKRAFKQ